ncbi:single-stranded DNA-binding protein [Rhizobium sp. NXC14]|uniref:ssDNA-binding protein n=1 Tax=Rhizobium sp. NXC14 TaxID=1981173 RepID=UPI000A208414|nr:ssDNA-binding protein [Rhizobium sp. NXC14]ARO29921.1 single-stranded DNA-binding protein [Rhizobium sp. NXC14]
MADKKKNPSLNSPRGPLKFPKIDKVDYGTKEYPKPNGEYSTKLVLEADAPATKAFIAALMPHYQAAMEEAAAKFKELKVETRKKLGKVTENDLFTTLYDQETEQPTGYIEFKFAMAASGERKDKTKWAAKPAIFDAKGKPMVKVPEIWSGTEAKVSFECQPYFIPGTGAAGLKLKLKAVQIIDLVSGGQRSASSYGFGAEDGYEYEEPATEENESGFGDESGEDTSSKTIDDDIPF